VDREPERRGPAREVPAAWLTPGRTNSPPDESGAIFVGEKGYLTSDTYGANVRLLPESRHKEYSLPPQVLTRSPGHHQDWIRAAKGGEPACSNFSVSGPFTEFVQLGVLASHFDGKLEWDIAHMRVANRPEANRFLKPEVRKARQAGRHMRTQG
jgi:hypothetical protein